MTYPGLANRLRAAARDAQAQPEICAIDGPCRCPTCSIVEMLVHSELTGAGYSRNQAERVTVGAANFDGASYPYLASVRVDGREVYRIMRTPDEALAADVMDDIKTALEA
jgi:hypothetical protein